MLELLKTPEVEYKDYYEKARFKLTWNVTVTLVVFLVFIFVFFTVVDPKYALHYGLGAILTFSASCWLYVKRTYKVVAVVLTISCFFLVNSSLFFLPQAVHYIEPFWLFIIALYAYFTLGIKWGNSYVILSVISVGLYFTNYINENILAIENISLAQGLGMALEFSLCSMIIGYIVTQFIRTNRWAESELKKANERISLEKGVAERHNKEKTILLQEIHHRVKNNLQVITSLLRMQSSNIESEESQEHFKGAINRIMTMSLVHQKMYEKDNLGDIGLKEYLDSLITDLLNSASSELAIKYSVQSDLDHVGMKSIVPLALIITELVTNSIKHAFDEHKGKPEIVVQIKEAQNTDSFQLSYFDNGVWKDPKSNSFGTELIDMLTEQLEGELQLDKNEFGTTYLFQLKKIDNL